MSCNEETRKWMYVRSDMQIHDQERTHPRNNESDAGFQQDHGETTELVLACDEESVEDGYNSGK